METGEIRQGESCCHRVRVRGQDPCASLDPRLRSFAQQAPRRQRRRLAGRSRKCGHAGTERRGWASANAHEGGEAASPKGRSPRLLVCAVRMWEDR
jgi:hypothetical protein